MDLEFCQISNLFEAWLLKYGLPIVLYVPAELGKL